MTENLDLYGTIGYGMRDYKMENGYTDDHTEKYYSKRCWMKLTILILYKLIKIEGSVKTFLFFHLQFNLY